MPRDNDKRLEYVDYRNMAEVEVADFAFDWQFYFQYHHKRACSTEEEKIEYLNKFFSRKTIDEKQKSSYAKQKDMENLYQQERI